ncbi:MAG: hypothetical protein MUD01_10105 [Chloroflexaceae bacterium]|jgi:hypothetical protein|nr:hypothetical protein [Chloroflexaceae bacterium]
MLKTLDTMIARVLWVKPHSWGPASADTAAAAERVFSISLLISATRCTVMYVLLPFVLPLLGLAVRASLWLTLLIDLVAIGALVYSLRRFWQVNYRYKWSYLVVALGVAATIAVFLYFDIRALLA